MIGWFSRLLFQIRCVYCFKPITQVEERRLGKVSLCPDCFNYIRGARSQARSVASSSAFSDKKMLSIFEERHPALSHMHFLEKSSAFSFRKCKHLLRLILCTFSLSGDEKK